MVLGKDRVLLHHQPFRWYGNDRILGTQFNLVIIRNLLACLFSLLLVTTAHGARLDKLFQAEVGAAGRDSGSRDAALRLALQDVLVRVTGSADSINEPEMLELVGNPGRFVEQYRYRQQAPQLAGEAERLILWVQFDGIALAKRIRQAGLPFWGHERPDVLVWLAVDDVGQRYLVSESSESEAAQVLRQTARLRGLPLTLPLMDLQDQQAVRFTDVWGGFVGTLEAASQRYRPQLILIGKLGRSASDAGWRGDWNLLGAGVNQGWTSHAPALDQVVATGVGEATEWLAVQYAVVMADETRRTLVVEGIHGLQDYARAYSYLDSLTVVDRVQVERVAEQEVAFSLKLSAEERNLLQVIALGKVLQAIEGPSPWRFRLNP
jgi:hypothetical protein